MTLETLKSNRGVTRATPASRPILGRCRITVHLRAVIEVDGIPVRRGTFSGEVCGFNDASRLLDDFEEYVLNNTGVLEDDGDA